ncbi:MAG: alpha-2-macroglobulin family protein [Myxococcota bacterium]
MLWAEPMKQPRQRYRQQHALSWVQGTEIALTAVVDRETLIGWAAQLEDGASIEGASLSLFPVDGAAVKTDASGLGEIEVPTANAEEQTILIARKGGDVAFIPEREGRWYGGARWVQRSAAADLLWFIFDDRQLYRPGETVQVKGWIRAIDRNEGGDTTAAALGDAEVAWQLLDSRRNEVAKGTTSLTRLGGFDLALALPDTINLGYGQLVFRVPGHTERSHSIRIEAFRRPEFEVSVNAPPDVVTLGDEIVLTASASYYAGGVLPGAVVGWSAEASTTTFTPPNRDEYRFGKWTPWWLYRDSYGGSLYEQFSGKTDASGAHRLSLRAESLANPRPLSVVVSASVTDVNRQTFSGSKTILIHPSSVYVGVKPSRPFYPGDMPVKLDLIAVDVAGNLEAGHPIAVEIVRKTWGPDKAGRWVESVAEEHACSVTSATSARDCTFTPESGGSFEITARVTDDLGRPNETVSTVWVSGGEAKAPRRVGASSVTLVPDKETYVPGDVAEILVQSPITPAEVLVTVRRSGVVHTERHRLDASGLVLNVPIRDEYVPNVFVQVDVVGGELRRDASGEGRADLPQQPAYGTGELNLSVSTLRRALTVAVTPASSSLVPGGETPLRVTVTDADGQPVSDAEVVVVAVDESVLALTGYKIGDPLAAFYPQRPEDTRETWLHRWVYLEDPEDIIGATGAMAPPPPDEIELEEAGFMPMGGALAPPAAPSPATGVRRSFNKPAMLFAMADRDMGQDASGGVIAVRSNFDPLAMFVPAAVTDTKGEARLRLEVPDNLTRYRITAIVAAGENRFGSAESTVTARLPLMIRPAAPRFLNFGDRFELPVVVQNQTDEPMAVSLAVQATNALFTDDPSQGAASSGRRLTVAAGDRAEVRFPAKTDAAGTARFQVAVSAGDFSDAAEVSLPVWTPATSEAFATYGVLDNDGGIAAIRQPVVVPDDVFPQFGGLEVTTSTTAVGALTDAVIHLVDYPYGCSEQIASRVLAVAALRDVLTAFDAEGLPDAEALSANVTADLEELRSRQNPDGGFGFWRQGEESWPFLTLHVAHAVVRAKEKGYAVDSRMEARLMTYLQDIQRRFPSGYGPEIRRVLEAYAVYIRHLDGDVDGAAARRLVRDLGADKGALEALGWLLPTLHQSGATQSVEAILRRMNNQVSETAAAAHFVTRYTEGDDLILHSNRRTDGILLDALVRVRPESPLIPKLVEGVLGDRTRGQWGSTQDNAFVLLAMDRYFRTFEGTTPDLVARVWLGDRLAGSQTFQGRSTDKAHINAPMAWMQEAGGDVIMSHEGVGRLYYRIGMRYAPRSLELEPREAGFAVTRTYEAVDEPEDVIANPDGSWTVRAGARVRARVTMAAPGRRSHVALVDPLPAGFEVLNPELAMTESLPPPGSPKTFPGRWWWGPWYSYENLRDERVEAFATRLWGGVYEYTYVARATTPGVFVVPPAKAEEMYHPETFGRTGTVRVAVVEP